MCIRDRGADVEVAVDVVAMGVVVWSVVVVVNVDVKAVVVSVAVDDDNEITIVSSNRSAVVETRKQNSRVKRVCPK